ncbi:hypothetical protein [Viridibacillus arvi]|uniref:hypothetical protein n=1 Tax=Viridibacillus arvi TaxID=263475 RepID=UPI0034CE9498
MDNTILKEAVKRAPSQRERILGELRKAGKNGVLNTDLVKLCIRYTGRLAELYQMGYKIKVEYVEKGVCIYTLLEEPVSPIKSVPTAISVLVGEIEETYRGAITAENLVSLLQEMNFNVVRKCGSHKLS